MIKNYLKIYFWKILGLLSGFGSMLLVIPKITSDINSYGIYSICISLGIFLSYSDIGFLSSGQKYATEAYGRNNRIDEIEILGFVHFILLFFVLIFSIIIFYISFNQSIIINSKFIDKDNISQKILIILSLSAPNIVLQRFSQAVFAIRIEDFIFQKIELASNIIKIIFVFILKWDNKIDIVYYYLFMQLMSFLVSIISILIIRKKYNYDIIYFFKSLKYSKKIFKKVNKLAFSSLFVTLMWFIYYELDTLIISKFYGTPTVAIYAIAISLLSFTRSIYGTIFSPFLVRMNQYIGNGENKKFESFFFDIISLTTPLCVIPAITLILMMNNLILSWVGSNYFNSILIAQILISTIFFTSFTNTISFLIITKEKYLYYYSAALCLSLVFLISFYFFKSIFSINGLAISKLSSSFIYTCILILFSTKIFLNNVLSFILSLFKDLIIPVIFLLIILFVSKLYWNTFIVKSSFNLFKLALIGGLASLFSIILFYFINYRSKNIIKKSLIFLKFLN